MRRTYPSKMASPTITIIGAGLAGLTCAYRLKKLGYPLELYEASERPGGRVQTFYHNDSYEELGGKFIGTGADAKHIAALSLELGLELDAFDIPFTKAFIENGHKKEYFPAFHQLPPPTDTLLQSLKQKAKIVQSLSDLLDHFFADHPSLRALFELRIRNYEGSSSKELSPHYVEIFWPFYKIGHRISSAQKDDRYTFQGIRGGNGNLPIALSDLLKEEILYKTPLKKIAPSSKGKLSLQLGKKTIQSDLVVLALPLPILRQIEIDSALLSEKQKQHFTTLPFGSHAKILIPLEHQKTQSPEFGYTEDALVWFNKDHTILTLLFGGPSAQFPNTRAHLEKKYEQELPSLKRLYPDITFPPSSKILGNCWTTDPHFSGSYTNFGTTHFINLHEIIRSHGEFVKKLFLPLQNKVFFCGEHTALAYPATMEGAIESGERTARMLINSIDGLTG